MLICTLMGIDLHHSSLLKLGLAFGTVLPGLPGILGEDMKLRELLTTWHGRKMFMFSPSVT